MRYDRNDGIVDLCEMKCTDDPLVLGKDDDEKLRLRTSLFRLDTKTRKSIHTVVVSASGIVRNAYAYNVQATLTLDDLFKE